jgi:tRNA nucleotidyltransferase (CCA-adding enzyme)
MTPYETFDHEADVGIRGYGETLEEAFEEGARALFSLMVEIDAVKPTEERAFTCDAHDPEGLFVEWLNHLIALAHIEGMVFSRFKTEIRGETLYGKAWGEALDKDRHHPMSEVKAATYCMLLIYRDGDRHAAQCVVDV